jgi:hypothetical protein
MSLVAGTRLARHLVFIFNFFEALRLVRAQ